MKETTEGKVMALREIRLDLDTPVKLIEAFLGFGNHCRMKSTTFTGVFIDGNASSFKVTTPSKPPVTLNVVETGTQAESVPVTAVATGLYGEKIQLELVYRSFKDKVYKQERPAMATIAVRCTNLSSLRYPPDDIFVMISAEFSTI